jgi:hypothetical protein
MYSALESIIAVSKTLHLPVMLGIFVVAVFLRVTIYYTVRRHEWFSRQFELRVNLFLKKELPQKSETISFFMITKRLLERCFYEIFEQREKVLKSNPDKVMLLSDRLFLIKKGCAWLVHDILKQIRFLRYGLQAPRFLNITKSTFYQNPAFKKVFGIIPISSTNDLLNLMPGLFVIGGILGTFLGVMKGLPSLGGMDLNDPEKTKFIMDQFLISVAMSMGASVTGIFLSVVMTVINNSFSPDRVFVETIDRFENCLDLLWNYANSNEVPVNSARFDENKDPAEALAEASIAQIIKMDRSSPDFEKAS